MELRCQNGEYWAKSSGRFSGVGMELFFEDKVEIFANNVNRKSGTLINLMLT